MTTTQELLPCEDWLLVAAAKKIYSGNGYSSITDWRDLYSKSETFRAICQMIRKYESEDTRPTPAPDVGLVGELRGYDENFDSWNTDRLIPQDLFNRILTALSASGTGWRPIESAPHEELVVLGWYEGQTWKQEIALASAGERFDNGYSNRWFHGQATHWQPLSTPPQEAGQ